MQITIAITEWLRIKQKLGAQFWLVPTVELPSIP